MHDILMHLLRNITTNLCILLCNLVDTEIKESYKHGTHEVGSAYLKKQVFSLQLIEVVSIYHEYCITY